MSEPSSADLTRENLPSDAGEMLSVCIKRSWEVGETMLFGGGFARHLLLVLDLTGQHLIQVRLRAIEQHPSGKGDLLQFTFVPDDPKFGEGYAREV